MCDGQSELAKQAQGLGKAKASDHVANIVKATLNAVPFVGGSIASLIDDYIPESRQKRIEKFSKGLADEMERLGDSLDANFVKTDEFAYLFTRVYQDVTRDYQQEKLIAYRNILVNALHPTHELGRSNADRILKVVESLTREDILVLAVFRHDWAKEKELYAEDVAFVEAVRRLSGLEPLVVERSLFELRSLGLIIQESVLYSLGLLEVPPSSISSLVTPFGNEVARFISES